MNGIVITGIGIIAPNGIGFNNFWEASVKGKMSIAPSKNLNAEFSPDILVGEVSNDSLSLSLKDAKTTKLTKSAGMLISASNEAIQNAQLSITDANCHRIGMVTGNCSTHLFSMYEFDREVSIEGMAFADPFYFTSTVLSEPSSQVSIQNNIQGFNTTVSSSRTSALSAIEYASSAIHAGIVDIVVCGSVETLSYPLYKGLNSLGLLRKTQREETFNLFNQDRDGFVPGEASCVFIVESKTSAVKRGARIYAKLDGINTRYSPTDQCSSNDRGNGLQNTIQHCLTSSGMDIKQVDYICSSANSSNAIDLQELKALTAVWGDRLLSVPISVPSSMIGDTISASGGIQLATALGALQHHILPPSVNQEKDQDCPVDCIPNIARRKTVDNALVSSIGFGGFSGACIVSND